MIKQLLTKIKVSINILFLLIIDYLATKKADINSKCLLVIRLDAIGDYILFRNFLQTLKTSNKYANYTITLLGNRAWQELAEELDISFVDHFIWLDRNKFYKNYLYRFNKLREISAIGYDTVINPLYSREYFFSEAIIKCVSANQKIGCEGDIANISYSNKMSCDKNYTKLLPNTKSILFEFYRNLEFFEQLLDEKLINLKFTIDLPKYIVKEQLPDKYAVLFLGGSHLSHQWAAEHFAYVGEYLRKCHDYQIVICGAMSDYKQAKLFKKYFSGEYIDLVGKTSLLELLLVIQNSQCIISNETSAVHMAVALSVKPIFVIYNGKHFGRFVPYPDTLCKDYFLICHSLIDQNKEKYIVESQQRDYINQLDVNDITTDRVIDAIRHYYR